VRRAVCCAWMMLSLVLVNPTSYRRDFGLEFRVLVHFW
jgi:hypothetical protein